MSNSQTGLFLIGKDGIINIQNPEDFLQVLASNYDVSIKTVVDIIEREDVGVFIEIPIGYKKSTVLVDKNTLSPYCLTKRKRLRNKKFILVNPGFSDSILKEFWLEGEPNG